jgi:hypothetical protein
LSEEEIKQRQLAERHIHNKTTSLPVDPQFLIKSDAYDVNSDVYDVNSDAYDVNSDMMLRVMPMMSIVMPMSYE